MRIFLRCLLPVLLLAPGLRAQGLVQISLSGAIDTPGGGNVEIEVSYLNRNDNDAPVTATIALVLGESTSAFDVALLVARRLESHNLRVTTSGPSTPMRGPVNLFVEGVVAVGLRLGQGLNASVTLCEDRPLSIKLTPGRESKKGASISVVAHTWLERTKEVGRVTVRETFPEKSEPTDVAARLVRAAIGVGWTSELTGHYTWLPGAMTETERVTACSIELRSNADWRLDVVLAPRTAPR
ncbi:MAG: hypothetical protein JNL28_00020 [Planctomycetes bacterium]|nr:hypothetical protein [Planctomycetota bacterium]